LQLIRARKYKERWEIVLGTKKESLFERRS
jgi:hypothetical protein